MELYFAWLACPRNNLLSPSGSGEHTWWNSNIPSIFHPSWFKQTRDLPLEHRSKPSQLISTGLFSLWLVLLQIKLSLINTTRHRRKAGKDLLRTSLSSAAQHP
ncbi:hypothetical protein BJX64DRAFT_69369 [Aspergillus heterothallicus]